MMALPLVFGLAYIPIVAVSIYCIVLFVKLATRGIKALDIYIENSSES